MPRPDHRPLGGVLLLLLLLLCLCLLDAVEAFRKCCPAGQQLAGDARSCTPLRRPKGPGPGRSGDDHPARNPNFYSTDVASDPKTPGRSRRDADDWGWLPSDVLIMDSSSLQLVTLDDLRRAARDTDGIGQKERAGLRGVPGMVARRVEWGAPPPCSPGDTELLFWEDSVQLFSNGSLLVHQDRADLFRPPTADAAGTAAAAGDEGTRSFLFPPAAFCMDRLTLSPVVTVSLDADPQAEQAEEDNEMEVKDAVLDEEARRQGRDHNQTDAANNLPPDEDPDDPDDPDTHHVILLCPCAGLGHGVVCVRKCCHQQSVLVVDAQGNTACHTDPDPDPDPGPTSPSDVASAAQFNAQRALRTREWGPSQHRHPDRPETDHFLLHALPQCSNPEGRHILLNPASIFNSTQLSQFWILEDGSAQVDIFGVDAPIPANAFCGEIALDAATGLRSPDLLVCADSGVLVVAWERIVFGVLAAVGAAFLAATLLVHACLPELRRSLHSSNLMAHTGSLLVAYITLAVYTLAGSALPRTACLWVAFILQFSFLAAFFWLNVMCVDISWAFSGLRLPQGSAAERDRKKFRWYSLYAWGGSSAITLVTAAVNFLAKPGSSAFHPQIGALGCWFKETHAVMLFVYGPMAFLLLANVVLFVYTAGRILAVRRDTDILHKADSARSHSGADTQRLLLYVKLFCLMGLTWVTEILSYTAGGRNYFWYATDAVNLLRAVFIFIIFCCKRKVLRLVMDRMTGKGGRGMRGRGRGGVGPGGGRGAGGGTVTSSLQTGSLTIHQDARRLQQTGSQDSAVGSNTTTMTSPSATPEGIVLNLR